MNSRSSDSKVALLVIDVQESFRARPYWQSDEAETFIGRTQALVDRCRASGIPVLQVFHQEPDGEVSSPFHPQSGLVRTLRGLDLAPDAVFYKEVHSAMFARSSGD